MATEDEKQLRQLLRKAHQLPQPKWDLFARTSTRFSKFAPPVKQRIRPVKRDETPPSGKK